MSNRNFRKLTYVAAAAIAAGLGWAAWSGKLPLPVMQKEQAKAPLQNDREAELVAAVSVVRVVQGDFVEQISVTGTLVARDEILVGSEVEGLRIVEVLGEEGQRVRRGDVLARLVTDILDAQLEQNEAALARADAGIAQAESNILAAEARRDEARNALDRARPLRQSGVISEATQDTREATAKSAEAALVAARDGKRLAEADRRQLLAVRRDLEWRRSRTDIRAPADGIISRRTAKVGAFAAGMADPFFRIVRNGEIEFHAEVPEALVGRIKAGDAASIEVLGAGNVSGTVRLISPEIDRQTRLGRVRIFLGDDARLRVGAFARGTVVVARSQGLSVPSSALIHANGGVSVQVVENGRIVARQVKTGITTNGMVEVVVGVREAELVVARAGTFLRDGDRVRPIIAGQQVTEISR